ncbi:hypothetical protein [Halospeciosus flavus]|uniref:hypothetical protein n=1 Tax=Halospeciosus flavus TaxID=3032283 RepID=UPI00361F4894
MEVQRGDLEGLEGHLVDRALLERGFSCIADAMMKFPDVNAWRLPWLYWRILGGSPPVS